MVDRFSLKGEIDSYEFDEACIRHSTTKHDTQFIKKMRIPNREETSFLDASYLKHEQEKIWITGNLRKWWYESGRAVRDLNLGDLISALEFLAKRLNTDLANILIMPIRKLELGMNLKLEKEAALFIPALLEMPQRERKLYGRDTVYFEAENERFILYNKIQQMHDKEGLSANSRNKILECIFILRFELQIFKPSAYKGKSYITNFGAIIRNFDILINELVDNFLSIQYVDPFCKGKNIKAQSLTKREFQQYLIFLTLKEYGIDFTYFMSDRYVKSHNATSRSQLKDIYNKFNTNENRQHFAKIAAALFNKRSILSNNHNNRA